MILKPDTLFYAIPSKLMDCQSCEIHGFKCYQYDILYFVGRTGVLIACFLVFHNRMSANEAVHFVRSKRPGSVQTTPQVNCVQEFEKFLKPYRVIFYKQ